MIWIVIALSALGVGLHALLWTHPLFVGKDAVPDQLYQYLVEYSLILSIGPWLAYLLVWSFFS